MCVCACARGAAGEQHQLLEFINRRFDEFVPGVSSIGLLMCFLASATTLLGPVTIEFISSVRPDGSQATWSQPAGCFYLFVAGPGQFKSGTMQICSNAIHAVLHAVKVNRGNTANPAAPITRSRACEHSS